MRTIAIIEGFSGGPINTRRFREELSEAGFKVIKNRQEADIIVAHSAGIYAVPINARAGLLMLIGPTYWPGRALLARLLKHSSDSRKYYVTKFGRRYYARKKLLELYYFFTRNRYLWLGIIHNNRLSRLEKLISKPERKIIIIRNQDDAYSGKQIAQKIHAKNVKFIEMPGIHDDYYENPKPYVQLLMKECV